MKLSISISWVFLAATSVLAHGFVASVDGPSGAYKGSRSLVTGDVEQALEARTPVPKGGGGHGGGGARGSYTRPFKREEEGLLEARAPQTNIGPPPNARSNSRFGTYGARIFGPGRLSSVPPLRRGEQILEARAPIPKGGSHSSYGRASKREEEKSLEARSPGRLRGGGRGRDPNGVIKSNYRRDVEDIMEARGFAEIDELD